MRLRNEHKRFGEVFVVGRSRDASTVSPLLDSIYFVVSKNRYQVHPADRTGLHTHITKFRGCVCVCACVCRRQRPSPLLLSPFPLTSGRTGGMTHEFGSKSCMQRGAEQTSPIDRKEHLSLSLSLSLCVCVCVRVRVCVRGWVSHSPAFSCLVEK